jgi:hypothetical protein
MRTTMIFLLAVLPPSAIWAQDTKPTAPNATNTQPGQGSAKPGANLCGHVIDAGTFVDARAQNASHEDAWVIRWLDPKGTAVHSALGMGRCVVKDGDTIDGKVIVRVLPNSLAVSNRHALTGWEAEYWNYPGEQAHTPHRGAFSDGRFITELDPSKASELGSTADAEPDFRWNEEQETLVLKPGVVLIPPPVHFAYQPAAPPPCVAAPAKASGVMAAVKKQLERTLEKQAAKGDADITRNTKGGADAGLQDITTAAVNDANQSQPCTPVAKGKGPSK